MHIGRRYRFAVWPAGLAGVSCLVLSVGLAAQEPVHGRKYQPPPATGHIVIEVTKASNGKPLENVAVVFHATKNGKDNGNLELKTNSQGQATMDLIEVGSNLHVQVIASGYATAAQDFDVSAEDQTVQIKLQRPRAQVSVYQDNDGKAAAVQPGIQEHHPAAPAASPAATPQSTAPAAAPGAVPATPPPPAISPR